MLAGWDGAFEFGGGDATDKMSFGCPEKVMCRGQTTGSTGWSLRAHTCPGMVAFGP